ncbi:MAG: septum formation inhibitor Maf [Oceanospirillaceae bacterium]|nr:septum formation inhibitor Maf [Oceanospirillaceae bacterium]MCP5335401.1 septum formation inhibitor Maf [Oceanospirillaceae bacterium]MCP5351428.1 septum formation inhibitor Maf [Oceanospirillaceae bacterium]
MKAPLVLASSSPRRRELLQQIGVEFEVRVNPVDETPLAAEKPADYVRRLAIIKAQASVQADDTRPVLGADTTVVCNGEILGKPANLGDAKRILGMLSGRAHQVMTAIALVQGEQIQSEVVVTDVVFRNLSDAEIEAYWATGEPSDKAGAYGIQGKGAVFVARIEGSYSAVVGLPLAETAALLTKSGVPLWQ